ncbi:hypothetical protein [Corynebacterium phoceense]|uniref:hypothetical protein n=1 Tax=Corynebacterium phoceense TaxID=1686286 RepID=UPI000839BA78|nr:hypothetical protein [Corynebacterium phoceense]
MREVVLTKSVRLAADRPIARAGQMVSVDDATYTRLEQLGAIAPGDVVEPESDDHEQETTGEDQELEPEVPAPAEPTVKPAPRVPLPEKTAPVAEWREYARLNGIKLTGLTKRNEIIGFVTKAAGAAS